MTKGYWLCFSTFFFVFLVQFQFFQFNLYPNYYVPLLWYKARHRVSLFILSQTGMRSDTTNLIHCNAHYQFTHPSERQIWCVKIPTEVGLTFWFIANKQQLTIKTGIWVSDLQLVQKTVYWSRLVTIYPSCVLSS